MLERQLDVSCGSCSGTGIVKHKGRGITGAKFTLHVPCTCGAGRTQAMSQVQRMVKR